MRTQQERQHAERLHAHSDHIIHKETIQIQCRGDTSLNIAFNCVEDSTRELALPLGLLSWATLIGVPERLLRCRCWRYAVFSVVAPYRQGNRLHRLNAQVRRQVTQAREPFLPTPVSNTEAKRSVNLKHGAFLTSIDLFTVPKASRAAHTCSQKAPALESHTLS